jgi:hypothetical protein
MTCFEESDQVNKLPKAIAIPGTTAKYQKFVLVQHPTYKVVETTGEYDHLKPAQVKHRWP